MKAHLASLIRDALVRLEVADIPEVAAIETTVERARQKGRGDFATKIAFSLAKQGGTAKTWAERLCAALPPSPMVERAQPAGAGFVNFFMSEQARHAGVRDVLSARERFGRADLGRGRRVMVEFVSANPNGPLHVGHGRGAAFGDSLARLLEATGWNVEREYYVNDAGRQMDILAASVWIRYLEQSGATLPFPANGYRGSYVRTIAQDLAREYGPAFKADSGVVTQGLPRDEADGGDKEEYIDALINRARTVLGAEHYAKVHGFGLQAMLSDIRSDLEEFGVAYDTWYSERGLIDRGAVAAAITELETLGHVYREQGALWFRSTTFGDEKDRVLVRENGVPTYFASDIAYHLDKINRGFDLLIDVWGADHHGHVPRINAALSALARDPRRLEVLLVQFAALYRGKERVAMSTRAGEFVTLRDLRSEVGRDAARFFYVLRKNEQHMDFDLELAKSQSNDNPVFYIQYAHARIRSVFRQLEERTLEPAAASPETDLAALTEAEEHSLMFEIGRYPEVITEAARRFEPHQVAYYLRDVAQAVHAYYNAHGFLTAEPKVRAARLALLEAARIVIANGLAVLGVSAPEQM
ncbi:MAG: arginine--tRNA ligase [Acidiferrobacteraceae bacterium]